MKGLFVEQICFNPGVRLRKWWMVRVKTDIVMRWSVQDEVFHKLTCHIVVIIIRNLYVSLLLRLH